MQAKLLTALSLTAALALAGQAQAKPRLSMHRAHTAAMGYQTSSPITEKIAACTRRNSTTIACDVRGFLAPGDPNGPVITCDGCTDATGQELSWLIVVTLRHGHVRIADDF